MGFFPSPVLPKPPPRGILKETQKGQLHPESPPRIRPKTGSREWSGRRCLSFLPEVLKRMRRQEFESDKGLEIADASLYGVLSMVDPQGMAYGVPLNFWRQGDRLYFHSARTGRKIDCLRANPHVSICFVREARVIPEAMTTKYASAIVTGTARELTDTEEKRQAAVALCRRYQVPEERIARGFHGCLPAVAIWEITPDSVTGKERL